MNEMFSSIEEERSARYDYKGPAILRLDAEVIDLPPGTHFKSCAETTILNAREIRGSGAVDTSGAKCQREERKGGDLILSALVVDGISLNSSGGEGVSGKHVDPSGLQPKAENGTPDSAHWNFNWGEQFTGKLCVTELSCQWDNLPFPDQVVLQNRKTLERTRMVDLTQVDTAITKANEFCRAWWCWVSGEKNPEGHRYLFLNWMASLNNDSLNGRDAILYKRGSAGGDGGLAGQIAVLTMEDRIHSISSLGGRGGKASASFCQAPGGAAELTKLEYETHEINAGFSVVCARKEKDLNGKYYMHFCSESVYGTKLNLKFKVGRDRVSPSENSSILGSDREVREGRFFGKNGEVKYKTEVVSDGQQGESTTTKRRVVESLDDFLKAFKEECPACRLPPSIEAEAAGNSKDSSEESL